MGREIISIVPQFYCVTLGMRKKVTTKEQFMTFWSASKFPKTTLLSLVLQTKK